MDDENPQAVYPWDPQYKELMREAMEEYQRRIAEPPQGGYWPLNKHQKAKKAEREKEAPSE